MVLENFFRKKLDRSPKIKSIARFVKYLFAINNYKKQKQSDFLLQQAREALSSGDYPSAKNYYLSANSCTPTALEPYIGISICFLEGDEVDAAIDTLHHAREKFGNNEAILNLLTTSYVNKKEWDTVENYWEAWCEQLQQPFPINFFHTCGNILEHGEVHEKLIDRILPFIINQNDDSVPENAHPYICELLFRLHEYNRPLYIKILDRLKKYVSKINVLDHQLSLAQITTLLAFDLVDLEQRKILIDINFDSFRIYSHWPFILLGSSDGSIWHESLKSNTKSIPFISDILFAKLTQSQTASPQEIKKYALLSNVCCREIYPEIKKLAISQIKNDPHNSENRQIKFLLKQAPTPPHHLYKRERLQIAVCVSGQLRGWKQSLASWKNIGWDEHDVTYFIHTWKDIGGGSPVPPKDARALPHDFQAAYRSVWNKFGKEAMFSRYPRFFGLWNEHHSDIDIPELDRSYGTKHIAIDDDSVPPFDNWHNAKKMYYKIWQCHNSAKASLNKFDLIVRIRPDLEFTTNTPLNWQQIYFECIQRRVLYTESSNSNLPTYFFPQIGYCIADHFAIATPEVMDAYANAYILGEDKEYSEEIVSGMQPNNFVAHSNVAWSTFNENVIVEGIKIPCRFVPAFKATKETLREALIHDTFCRKDEYDMLLLSALN